MQRRVSPGTTVHKLRLCPWLRLCCLQLLRRPCRPFSRRGSSRLGPAAVEPPLPASLRSLWITGPLDRTLLRNHSLPRENRASLGAPRLLRLRPSPRRPSYCWADSTRHRCGPTCSALAWCPPSRDTSACQHPRRSTRDAITGRSRVLRVCGVILAHRLGTRTTRRTRL